MVGKKVVSGCALTSMVCSLLGFRIGEYVRSILSIVFSLGVLPILISFTFSVFANVSFLFFSVEILTI